MNDYFILFLIPLLAACSALIFIIVLTPFADKLRLLDKPDSRKIHSAPVPMVGGIAIYLVLMCGLLIFPPPEKLVWFFVALTILVIIGMLDDAFGLGVKTRVVGQVLATSVMVFGADLYIENLGLKLFDLDSLGLIGIIITMIAVVGLTNGFNMVDGIDGLASGHLLVGIACVASVQWLIKGEIHQVVWLSVLFAAVLTFWLVNMSLTPLRRVFLGDAGSLLLGFVMSWVLIYYSQKPISLLQPVAALWCVTVPVFDTLGVIVRRMKNGRSPFSADRIHLHHLLVDQGISHKRAASVILCASISLNLFGLWLTYAVSPLAGLLVYALFFVIFLYGMLHPSLEQRILFKLGLLK